MKYMLLIHGEETEMNTATPPGAGMSPGFAAYDEALRKAGIVLAGERLRPTSTATSIRVTGDRTSVVDGPYAETKEQFGGFYLIDVPDLDQAVAWAARCPAAKKGTIEVRPIWPTDGSAEARPAPVGESS